MKKIQQLFALVLAPAAIGSVVAYSQPAHAATFFHPEVGDAVSTLPGQATGVSLAPGDVLNLFGTLSGVDNTDVFQFTYSGVAPSGLTLGALNFGLTVPEVAATVAFEIYKNGTALAIPGIPPAVAIDPVSGLFVGIFNPGDVVSVRFSQASTMTANYSAVFSATAVPTPALLPGLLGLGAAAWRKRKSQEEAVVA
jgi:hypothetical protein